MRTCMSVGEQIGVYHFWNPLVTPGDLVAVRHAMARPQHAGWTFPLFSCLVWRAITFSHLAEKGDEAYQQQTIELCQIYCLECRSLFDCGTQIKIMKINDICHIIYFDYNQ